VDTISTIFSQIPSIPNTDDIYPTLVRSTELANILKAQELYNELLQVYNPNEPNYIVYKTFLGYAKRIFFRALQQGLQIGTPEFTEYMDDILKNNGQLIKYLDRNGVDINEILG